MSKDCKGKVRCNKNHESGEKMKTDIIHML